MKRKKPIVAITIGDPNGIGSEITAKALNEKNIHETADLLVIADASLMEDAVRFCGLPLKINRVSDPQKGDYQQGVINVLDMKNFSTSDQEWGKVSAKAGKASYEYIAQGINLAMEGKIDAVVTGPLHKEAINAAGIHKAGHTEIFAELTNSKRVCMMLTDGHMRVSHVTTHVAMAKVKDLITPQRILDVIKLTHDALLKMGIESPTIAVAGYNPHAGENGLFGDEEMKYILPAIEEAKGQGYQVRGPVPPDTVFVSLMAQQYDAVLAMYHDQGHIPMKLAGFKQAKDGTMNSMSGVNVTLGLPIIRTSVDHGTAFGKAGKGTANHDSMMDAIQLAACMSDN